MDLVFLHAKIYGRVQGVGFRFYTKEAASRLGLTGKVRNVWDGTVEVEAYGPRNKIETFLEILKKGPRASRVERVKYHIQEVTSSPYKTFFIDY